MNRQGARSMTVGRSSFSGRAAENWSASRTIATQRVARVAAIVRSRPSVGRRSLAEQVAMLRIAGLCAQARSASGGGRKAEYFLPVARSWSASRTTATHRVARAEASPRGRPGAARHSNRGDEQPQGGGRKAELSPRRVCSRSVNRNAAPRSQRGQNRACRGGARRRLPGRATYGRGFRPARDSQGERQSPWMRAPRSLCLFLGGLLSAALQKVSACPA